MNSLVLYDNAKRALAEYKTVDEVKDFRDKALAVEAYAKQANDYELERDAAIARVRAERKCGELLADMEKAKGTDYGGRKAIDGRRELPSNPPKTLADMGVTKDQSSKWQRLAAVPEEEFEAAVSQPAIKPSANSILKPKSEPPPRMDGDALWWWGRLVDMERDKLHKPLASLLDEMTDAMRTDAERILPKVRRWINE